MVVDFDLANWDDNGTFVTGNPFLLEHSGNGLGNDDRHEHDTIEGVISDLSGTAPNQTFTLVREEDTVLVMTSAETELHDIAALSNGMHVELEGFFSSTSKAFLALSIEAEEDDMPEVLGRVNAIDGVAGTLDLVIEDADHFMPPFNVIHVVTSTETEFRNQEGTVVNAATFFRPGASAERAPPGGEGDVFRSLKLEHADRAPREVRRAAAQVAQVAAADSR